MNKDYHTSPMVKITTPGGKKLVPLAGIVMEVDQSVPWQHHTTVSFKIVANDVDELMVGDKIEVDYLGYVDTFQITEICIDNYAGGATMTVVAVKTPTFKFTGLETKAETAISSILESEVLLFKPEYQWPLVCPECAGDVYYDVDLPSDMCAVCTSCDLGYNPADISCVCCHGPLIGGDCDDPTCDANTWSLDTTQYAFSLRYLDSNDVVWSEQGELAKLHTMLLGWQPKARLRVTITDGDKVWMHIGRMHRAFDWLKTTFDHGQH